MLHQSSHPRTGAFAGWAGPALAPPRPRPTRLPRPHCRPRPGSSAFIRRLRPRPEAPPSSTCSAPTPPAAGSALVVSRVWGQCGQSVGLQSGGRGPSVGDRVRKALSCGGSLSAAARTRTSPPRPPTPPLGLPLEHSKLSFVGAGETRKEVPQEPKPWSLWKAQRRPWSLLLRSGFGYMWTDNDPGKLERDPSSSAVMVTRRGDNFL